MIHYQLRIKVIFKVNRNVLLLDVSGQQLHLERHLSGGRGRGRPHERGGARRPKL